MLITTKFMGPTDTKGARVKATSGSGKSIYFPWEHAADIDSNHAAAAEHLAAKLEREGATYPVKWVRRWSKDGQCIHIGLYQAELNKEYGQ